MDTIDVAQRRQQDDIDHALQARPAPGAGLPQCANLDCGEPINEVRRQMGATLCIDCQRAVEREAQRCARTAV